MPVGKTSWDATENASTKEAVETSKAVPSAYSFTLLPTNPTMNIFVPPGENATSRGLAFRDAAENEWTKEAVETSKAVPSAYSFTLLPAAPATNILVPPGENATPVGAVS